ncbi:MAG: Tryptophan synthase alpha chain [Myxococcaceae bacterium]|nr:Tryptophan synthase alpha chain [Myxococcaceae bacterium]
MRSFVVVAVMVAAGSALAVGCGDALVGGTCASGYEEQGGVCAPQGTQLDSSAGSDGANDGASDANAPNDGQADGGDGSSDGSSNDGSSSDGSSNDGSSSDGSSSDGSSSDGSSSDGAAGDASSDASMCVPPLMQCGAFCIDVSSDPDNCGTCGHVCASNICVAGKCQGEATGDIVYIGHDYISTPSGSAQAKLLTNAVLLAPTTPVRVLSYERYADAQATARLKTILIAAQAQTGRAIVLTSTLVDADVPLKLDARLADVLLVPDQVTAPTTVLAALGASWKTSLAPFTHAGGIFITLDGASGTAEMPDFETATGALAVSTHTVMAPGSIVQLVAASDALGTGVVSPFATRKSSSHFATEANAGPVVWVVVDGASSEPHVVHKVAP